MIVFAVGVGMFYLVSLLIFCLPLLQKKPISIKLNGTFTGFSVVIPVKNEQKRLEKLLLALVEMSYPVEHFELIFVDDHSEDLSESLLEVWAEHHSQLDIRIIKNSDKGKKSAIETGVNQAQYAYIVQTDADAQPNPEWLLMYHQFLSQNKAKFIAGPIKMTAENTLVQKLQQIECLALQSITAGAFELNRPIMANAANMVYEKSAFMAVDGFDAVRHFDGGDDVFLMEKIHQRFPKQTYYLAEQRAIVRVSAEKNFAEALRQRQRWAYKNKFSKNGLNLFTALVVLIGNAMLIALIIGFLFYFNWWKAALVFALFKFYADFLVLYIGNTFFK
ncbi:MAG: glycosyltransferase, partial [Flavobacteriaceae bacterium]|nr:glycosyltransferase [Flavobacteriaceae bacterium]